MTDITITLTDTEKKCLEAITPDIAEWLLDVTKNRAIHSKEEILQKLMVHCNQNGIAMATGEDAQVDQAYELKLVEKALPPSKEMSV